MRIVETLARDLKPGNVIAETLIRGVPGRCIVLHVATAQPGPVGVGLWLIGDQPGGLAHARTVSWDPEAVVRVERDDLTPAQEHAEELADRAQWLLGFVETYARAAMGPATPEFNKLRAVLALARPVEPPTLEELLPLAERTLRALEASDTPPGAVKLCAELEAMIARARAAGLLPNA